MSFTKKSNKEHKQSMCHLVKRMNKSVHDWCIIASILFAIGVHRREVMCSHSKDGDTLSC